MTTWWRGFEERDLDLGWENNGYFMDRVAAEDMQIYILVPDSLTTKWAQSYSFAELRHAFQNSNVLSHTTFVFGAHDLLNMHYDGGTPTRSDEKTSLIHLRQQIDAYTATLNKVSIPAKYGVADIFYGTSTARKIPLTTIPDELASYKGMRIENGILTQNFVQKEEDVYPPVLWSLNAPLAEGYVRAILSAKLTEREYAEKIHDVWVVHNRHRIEKLFTRFGLKAFEMGAEEIERKAAFLVREKANSLNPLEFKIVSYFRKYSFLSEAEKELELEKVRETRASLLRCKGNPIAAVYDLASGALHRSWMISYNRRHGSAPRYHPVPLSFIPESLAHLPGIELNQGLLYQRTPDPH